jgi:hypothetical protein
MVVADPPSVISHVPIDGPSIYSFTLAFGLSIDVAVIWVELSVAEALRPNT